MRRRTMMMSGAAATVAAALAGGAPATAQEGPMHERTGPPGAGPDEVVFPSRPHLLREGSAEEAGLVAEHVARIAPETAAFLEGPTPSFPGFVVLAARDGVVAAHRAEGHRVRYSSWDAEAGAPAELPPEQWEEATVDTIYDLASISKLFTAAVAGRFAQEGRIDFADPVVEHLPAFGSSDLAKNTITVGQLLAHTAGQVSWIDLYSLPDDESRMEAIFAEPLRRQPGSGYEYSDLNLIVLGKLLERVGGAGLDELVAEYITGPLGMTDTGYNPPADRLARVAATEYQPWTGRGMIRGSVHDENAWAFGGVAGHAGVFSTARDLAVFGQMILNGGIYGEARVLSEETARLVFTDTNAHLGAAAARGMGWQLGQRWYMDAMTSPVTAGHTGYTGTSIVLDPLSGTLLVLLSNRVHPTREWGTASAYRVAAARPLARAVPVAPRTGRDCWYAGQADGAAATLTADLGGGFDGARADFALWYDTEPTDLGAFEASPDGQRWVPVPLRLRAGRRRWETDGTFSGYSGRRWLEVEAELPSGTSRVRWVYRTDPLYQGRGVYIDRIRIRQGGTVVFNGDRPSDQAGLTAIGWSLSGN